MNKLHKTFFGKTIDLSKIIAISDVVLENVSASAYLKFHIDCELMDKPIEYSKLIFPEVDMSYEDTNENDEGKWLFQNQSSYFKTYLKLDNGEILEPCDVKNKGLDKKCVALQKMQEQVDYLICAWQKYVDFTDK